MVPSLPRKASVRCRHQCSMPLTLSAAPRSANIYLTRHLPPSYSPPRSMLFLFYLETFHTSPTCIDGHGSGHCGHWASSSSAESDQHLPGGRGVRLNPLKVSAQFSHLHSISASFLSLALEPSHQVTGLLPTKIGSPPFLDPDLEHASWLMYTLRHFQTPSSLGSQF
jgi:hypothetical protein